MKTFFKEPSGSIKEDIKGKGIQLEAVANSADRSEDRPGAKPALIGSSDMPFNDTISHQDAIVKREKEESDPISLSTKEESAAE